MTQAANGAREGAARSVGEVPMTEMAGKALTAAAVGTIARSGGLVTGRKGPSPHPTASNWIALSFMEVVWPRFGGVGYLDFMLLFR